MKGSPFFGVREIELIICLFVFLFQNKDVKAVLAKMMEPPERSSVDGAAERLQVGEKSPHTVV